MTSTSGGELIAWWFAPCKCGICGGPRISCVVVPLALSVLQSMRQDTFSSMAVHAGKDMSVVRQPYGAKCACGWHGKSTELRQGEFNTCPDCGGSGGLVLA